MATLSITLRPIRDEDMEFLLRLYGTTRADEMALVVDWTDEEKDFFVRMQFEAQHAQYHQHYGDAQFDLVLVKGIPAGRLYVHRRPTEIRLVDISFMPEYRNQGIGTALLKQLFSESEDSGKPVTIHVEKYNPAMRLYERLGFTPSADRGVYVLLERPPYPVNK